jgi:exodeoxyribonuclease VII large subunit
MIRILGARWPASEILVVPVRVQGTEAPGEISAAIRYVNTHRLADLIITGRGGGSIEDLWAFNEEQVARAIFSSSIPVISAVGHEPDVTIADYVADARASTPSNAAEIAVPDRAELFSLVEGYRVRADSAMDKTLDRCEARLKALTSRRVLSEPGEAVNLRRMDLDLMREKLLGICRNILSRKRHRFGTLAASLDALSPLKVLSRGYTAAFDGDNHVVKSVCVLEAGQDLRLLFADGSAFCTVDSVKSGQTERSAGSLLPERKTE